MNKTLFLLSTLLLLSGCDSDTKLMSDVKHFEYNGNTLEEIFEKSDYCDNVRWTEVLIKEQRSIRVVCTVDTEHFFSWGATLVSTFENRYNTTIWQKTYWADEQEKARSKPLYEEEAYALFNILLDDGEDYARR